MTPYSIIGTVGAGKNRGTSIGASDAPRLLGLDNNITAKGAFDAFVKMQSTPPNPFTQAGQFLEDGVMLWSAERERRKFLPWQERLRSTLVPFPLTCTPDGVEFEGEARTGLVEVKCTGMGQAKDHWGSGSPPDKVLCQTQLQMFVSGFERCVVVHWTWGQWPTPYDVRRDDKLIAGLVRELGIVWPRVVEERARLGIKWEEAPNAQASG